MRIELKIFAVMVILLMPAATAFGQFEGAAWDTLTADTVRDGLSRQPLCPATGGLHMTYAKERPSGGGWNVNYRYFDAMAGWTEDRIVEADFPCFQPVIASGGLGRIAILFWSNGDIYGGVVSNPWEDWSPVNLTNSSDDDLWPTVAVDSFGMVHCGWITQVDGEYKIAYGYGDGDSITPEVIEASNPGEFGSGAAPFIVLADNLPHIFYRGVTGFNYNIHHAYIDSAAGAWVVESLESPNADDYTASAVSDSTGAIHLTISGNDGFGFPGRIYYSRRDPQSGNWSTPTLVTGSYSAVDGNIGITSEGYVYVVSCGVSGNIYDGNIYLSDNASGHFQTIRLATFQDGTQPALTFIFGVYGAVVLQGAIGGESLDDYEIIYYGPTPSGVLESPPSPSRMQLAPNYPNPFNLSTMISFTVAGRAVVELGVFDIMGRRVRTLNSGVMVAGHHGIEWDGRDDKGNSVSSGIYIYRLNAGGQSQARKMALVK